MSIRGNSGTAVVSDRFIHYIYVQSDTNLFLDRLRAIYCELCMFGCGYVAWRVNRVHIDVYRCIVVEAVAPMGGVHACIDQHVYVRCMCSCICV